ncbi:MAG: hypothetical protein RXQ22_03035 [Sulfolobus sp.]
MKSVISFTSSILQLDKDWVTRITMAMIVLSIIWAESFFTLIEIFLSVCNKLLLINDDLSRRCGQKGWE